MSRSGYCDDYEYIGLYRGTVDRAIKGKRGQAFFAALLAALDAMPEKRLIAHELECESGVCALGALGVERGIQMEGVDPTDRRQVGGLFDIAPCLAAEVVFENDESVGWRGGSGEAPEERWSRMRGWVASNLKPVDDGEGSDA